MEHSLSNNSFYTAEEAFENLYSLILKNGRKIQNTKALTNVGFYILNPKQRSINTPWRKWKPDYAELEWNWYLSGNRSVSEIKKHAKIWDKMHNGDDLVNSNYGFQWMRGDQLTFVINELKNNEESRRAVITIYDGKENKDHEFDTPCTLDIVFNISFNKLNMTVLMRSNDLWFGFCNDQYCFSKLQELVALKLEKEVGWYYHFANNLHLYEKHYEKL